MNTPIYSRVCKLAIFVCMILSVACLKKDDRTIMLNGGIPITEIPDDSMATPNPIIDSGNVIIPNIITTVEDDKVIRIDMSGILMPKPENQPSAPNEYLRLYGTGDQEQNVWLEVDDTPKSVYVYNNADGGEDIEVQNDFVFLIDNSGSMDDEADAIARDIVEWATQLSSSLDVRFAIVGYDGNITGAINFTDADNISAYLSRSVGVDRTVGFEGDDAELLAQAAKPYNSVTDAATESPMAALLYANEILSFRAGANRVYVNFTDEPNSNYSREDFSVHYLASQENWEPSNGTIHTVYSSTKHSYQDDEVSERPWVMSEYTGGTVLFTDEKFTGVTLNDLPVTGAMQNSYVLKFANISEFLDNQVHEVKVTVMTVDRLICAERLFYLNFSTH